MFRDHTNFWSDSGMRIAVAYTINVPPRQPKIYHSQSNAVMIVIRIKHSWIHLSAKIHLNITIYFYYFKFFHNFQWLIKFKNVVVTTIILTVAFNWAKTELSGFSNSGYKEVSDNRYACVTNITMSQLHVPTLHQNNIE